MASITMFPSPTSVVAAALPPAAPVDPISLLPQEMVKESRGSDDDDGRHEVVRQLEQQEEQKAGRGWPVLAASAKSRRTINPIRAIVDLIVAEQRVAAGGGGQQVRADGHEFISMALGDPVAGGDLLPCPVAVNAVLDALRHHGHCAGYVSACGTEEARAAIARFHSTTTRTTTPQKQYLQQQNHAVTVVEDDPSQVIVANGCSGALELALTALMDANENSILLVPRPGFPLYQVITESHGARVIHYPLRPDQGWQVDLSEVERLILQVQNGHLRHHDQSPSESRDRICGIVINNPSNPTGAVYSKQHLQEILALCDKYHIPVIADEVYGDLTFPPHVFYPLAQVAHEMGRYVPVITASGIGKQFLVPGWRVGWIVFHDNIFGSLREVHAGAQRLAQVIMGASHLAQSAIPALLDSTNHDLVQWKTTVHAKLAEQAQFLCQQLATAPGLEVLPPQGAMYAMFKIHPEYWDYSIQNDVDFCKLLLKEENVLVLPGSCFGVDNIFRVVFCAAIPVLRDACNRIQEFCKRHHRGAARVDA